MDIVTKQFNFLVHGWVKKFMVSYLYQEATEQDSTELNLDDSPFLLGVLGYLINLSMLSVLSCK